MLLDGALHPNGPAFGRILHRVLQQVAKGAHQRLLIGLHRRLLFNQIYFHMEAACQRVLAEVGDSRAHQRKHVVEGEAVLLPVRLHAAEIQKILYEALQAPGFALQEHIALAAAGFAGEAILRQHFGECTERG
jgi:hypothetical protein